MSNWAVLKLDLDKEKPIFKIIPTDKISGGDLKVRTKLTIDGEVMKILQSERKAEDCLKLLMYRHGIVSFLTLFNLLIK